VNTWNRQLTSGRSLVDAGERELQARPGTQ